MEYIIYLLISFGFGMKCYDTESYEEWYFIILVGLLWPVSLGVSLYKQKEKEDE